MKNIAPKTMKNVRPRLTVVRREVPPQVLKNADNPEIIYPETRMPKQPQRFFKARKHDPL